MSEHRTLHIVQLISTSRHAGTENYVGRIADEFHRRGHRSTVISRFAPSAFVPDGPHLVQVDHWRAAARALRSLDDVDVVTSHGTEADVAAAWGLRGGSIPIVAIHHMAAARWSEGDGKGAALLRVRPSSGYRPPGPFRRRLQRSVDERIDVQVAVSDFVASKLPRCDVVVRSGVEPHTDVPEMSARSRTVVVMQRLEASKSTMLAVEAWERSTARLHGWSLEIHGEGRERQLIVDEVSQRDLSGSVIVSGRCSVPEQLMRSASLYLAPAVDEPFALALLEAMSLGLPVIAPSSGGVLESVGSVEGAALFPAGDADACAVLLDRLTSDEAERSRIAAAQLAAQRESFTIAAMCDRLEKVYADVTSS